MDDGSADPATVAVAFGSRLKMLRSKKGMTREALGGLLGHSGQWVKDLETGRRGAPRFDVVLALAEVLRVRDLAELTGGRPAEAGLFIGPGHGRLPQVQAALNALPAPGRAPVDVESLRSRIAWAWAARHSSPDHREVLGALLPDLLRDAQAAVRAADTGEERRAAQAVLAGVYALAQFFVAYQPDSSLLWRVTERGTVAAQESEDPHAIGVAAWLAVQAHRDSGMRHYDAAEQITAQALEYLEPLLPEASGPVLAITGALQFEAGYTAARRNEAGAAWAHWDTARQMAARLPEGYYHPVTSFSREIMGAHATTVAVELHQGGEGVRQAARSDATAIPSRPRRARHRIEQARAYLLDGQHETALAVLEQAHEAAPETIRWNGYAKRIVLEEVESSVPVRQRRASELAVKLGLLAA